MDSFVQSIPQLLKFNLLPPEFVLLGNNVCLCI